MQLRQLLGRLQSPNIHAVAEITLAVGHGLVVKKHKTVRFPNQGSCQVWGFGPHRKEGLDQAVVVVFFKAKTIESWKKVEMTFDQAFAHYQHQAGLRQEKVVDLPRRSLPALPEGVQVTLPAMGAASSWRLASEGGS